MYTLLEQSDNQKVLKNFRNLRWRSTNNLPNSSTETFWIVRTNFRMYTFIQYIKMKAFFDEITPLEARMLYDAPGVLSDCLFISALRAKHSDVQVNILLRRLAQVQLWLQSKPWTPNLYYTYNNSVTYELIEARQSIRKGKKYSGYVRNPSSVGSKKAKKPINIIPESFEGNSYEEFDWYEFLTIGKISGVSLEVFFPEED